MKPQPDIEASSAWIFCSSFSLQHHTNNTALVVPTQWPFCCTMQNHNVLGNEIKLLPVARERTCRHPAADPLASQPRVIYIGVYPGNKCSLPVTRLSLCTSLPLAQPKKAKGCVTIVTTALDTSEQGVKIENSHYTACISHHLALLSPLHLCTHMQDACLLAEFHLWNCDRVSDL